MLRRSGYDGADHSRKTNFSGDKNIDQTLDFPANYTDLAVLINPGFHKQVSKRLYSPLDLLTIQVNPESAGCIVSLLTALDHSNCIGDFS